MAITDTRYKLAEWDERSYCFKDSKTAQPSREAAIATATKPGWYRVSEITRDGRSDGVAFTLSSKDIVKRVTVKKKRSTFSENPMSGRPH